MFTATDASRMIEVSYNNYKLWHFGDRSDYAAEDHPKLASGATTGFEILRQLFCKRAEFASDEAGHEYLRRYINAGKLLVARLRAWCRELIRELLAQHCVTDSDQAKYFTFDK